MAEPPDINDTFLREVDENLRRDQMRDFFKRNGAYVIAAVVLFLAASGGFIWWNHYKLQQREGDVEQLAQIYRDVGAGNLAKAPQQLDTLAQEGNSSAVRASALFARAAVAIQQNDLKLATQKYREIANDGDVPEPYRNAALIRQTALEFDQLQPQEVISRMAPLAKPGEPWFGSAGEMTALALLKQDKKDEAARLFLEIAKDKAGSPSLRSRALQIAGSLGADISGVQIEAQ
ncbi:MAG TPA: tetratricopeptide repeat protein [Sphingomicrobium sp.]|nr:tetratricopeptide repeat protein [Sphingomicrobium sp.]